MSEPRRWEDQCWPDLGDLDGEVGLVPVGATEQHGPHLPTGTDTIIATAVCEGASRLTGAPVLPAVPLAASYGHGTVLPGTLSLSPELLATVARAQAEWAAASGLRRLVFLNAHFGNDAALGVATDHLRMFRPDIRVAVAHWWALDPVVSAEMTADGADVHANRAETSMMLAVAPHLVRQDRVADADDADRTADLVFRYTAPSLSTNGVTGRPSEASAELGAVLFERTVTALAELVERARVEEPPLGVAPPPDLSPRTLHEGVPTWTR
jgi:creatinine amidohydrolase